MRRVISAGMRRTPGVRRDRLRLDCIPAAIGGSQALPWAILAYREEQEDDDRGFRWSPAEQRRHLVHSWRPSPYELTGTCPQSQRSLQCVTRQRVGAVMTTGNLTTHAARPVRSCRRCVDVVTEQSGTGTAVFSLPFSDMRKHANTMCEQCFYVGTNTP